MSTNVQDSILIGKINAANPESGRTWEEGQLIFAAPAANVGVKNTKVVVTAAPNQFRTGSVELTYDRVNLSAIATAHGPLEGVLGSQTSTLELIDILINHSGATILGLSSGDLVDEALPDPDGDGTVTVEVKAIATSLLWNGSVSIKLTPAAKALSEDIVNTELDGLAIADVTGPA